MPLKTLPNILTTGHLSGPPSERYCGIDRILAYKLRRICRRAFQKTRIGHILRRLDSKKGGIANYTCETRELFSNTIVGPMLSNLVGTNIKAFARDLMDVHDMSFAM